MNYKKKAASEAAKLVKPHQVIGLGAGTTIAHLADELAADKALVEAILFVSSCSETTERLHGLGLKVIAAGAISTIDVYFDGCDQVDKELNALKSGGGIHTDEKALAAMAKAFILLGDEDKYADKLTTACPLTIEVMPDAIGAVTELLKNSFEITSIMGRKDTDQQYIVTRRDCALLNVRFNKWPELSLLNQIKLWPGIIDHSLFYQLATAAIICGPGGTKHLTALSGRRATT